MKHNCVICNQKIIEKKDRWVRLTDFNRGIEEKAVYYHLECWRDRFRISNSARKKKMYEDALKGISDIFKPFQEKEVEFQVEV